MDEDPKIEELADRWEAAHREGKSISPEDLCSDCPELLDAVKEAIADRMFGADFEAWACVGPEQPTGTLFGLRGKPTPPHAVGDKLGRYKLEEFLGAGGYGEVWRASDSEMGRDVAIKIMPRRERSLEEAKTVGQLSHPGIVPVYDIGHEENWDYVISKLIDGSNLAKLLQQSRLSKEEAVRIAADVADSLYAAHSGRYIHRDVKPGNILLDQQKKVYLADFGIAVSAEQSIDPDEASRGTLAYMSPEQVRGEARLIDARTDVYSLGLVLFEMLTGERPFRGDTPVLLKDIVNADPPTPRSFDAMIPSDLETVCLKCLEKRPRRRHASARDLADELRRYQRGEPILSRPLGRLDRFWRWSRRNLMSLILSALLAPSLVAVAFLGLERPKTHFPASIEQSKRQQVAYNYWARSLLWECRSLAWVNLELHSYSDKQVISNFCKLGEIDCVQLIQYEDTLKLYYDTRNDILTRCSSETRKELETAWKNSTKKNPSEF